MRRRNNLFEPNALNLMPPSSETTYSNQNGEQ